MKLKTRGEVGLIRQRDHVEHQVQPLVERRSDRHIGQIERAEIPLLHLLHAPLDLADAFEVVAELGAIRRVQRALQIGRLLRDQVENAGVLLRDGLALLRGIALTEEPLEQLARIGFHRQRRRRRPERNRAAEAAPVVAVAGTTSASSLRCDLERRERRVLADVRRRNLIDGDAAVRVLSHTRRHAAQPRAGIQRMHGGAIAGLFSSPLTIVSCF